MCNKFIIKYYIKKVIKILKFGKFLKIINLSEKINYKSRLNNRRNIKLV